MDLLVVCCLGVLINVLSHLTYLAPGMERHQKMNSVQVYMWNQYDVNGLSEDNRKLLCLARGRSIELIMWLSTQYTTGISDLPVRKLFLAVLIDVCKMLCNYKSQADARQTLCSPDFTIERLVIQIRAALELVIEAMDLSPAMLELLDWDVGRWKFPMVDATAKSILPQITELNIQKISALTYKRQTQAQLFKTGETALDRKLAQCLEVKKEIIGLCLIVFTVIFHPHF